MDSQSIINNNLLDEPILIDNDKHNDINDINEISNNKFINEQIKKVNNNI